MRLSNSGKVINYGKLLSSFRQKRKKSNYVKSNNKFLILLSNSFRSIDTLRISNLFVKVEMFQQLKMKEVTVSYWNIIERFLHRLLRRRCFLMLLRVRLSRYKNMMRDSIEKRWRKLLKEELCFIYKNYWFSIIRKIERFRIIGLLEYL